MKRLYIVLIKAHTGLGSFARRFTGYEYTHVAVSLDRGLTDFVSFSRRRHYLPFDAGFMHEKRDFYAFGKHKYFKAKVFAVDVPEENFSRVMRFIDDCEHDETLLFNLFSMATMPIFHGIHIDGAYNCMSFTAKVLELCGIELAKPYFGYSIPDIDALLDGSCIYEGDLGRRHSEGYARYMERCSPIETAKYGAGLILGLAMRMCRR